MVILFKGEETTKNVYGQLIRVVPFAGTDIGSRYPQMGVGLSYIDRNINSFWGVHPNDVVASFRGMKIAEQVPTFDKGTLAACWYAGHHERIYPHYQNYIPKIEDIIGAAKRQEILDAPLPPFDDAVQIMLDKDINFNIRPILAELEKGTLTMEPAVLERAVNASSHYWDRWFLFMGLAGDFEIAYGSLTEKPKGLLARLKASHPRNVDNVEVSEAYVRMVEETLPELIPAVGIQSRLFREVCDANSDAYASHEGFVGGYKKLIGFHVTEFYKAIGDLGEVAVSQLPPKQKFVAYHDALQAMIKAASKIEHESGKGVRDASSKDVANAFGDIESLAGYTIEMINRIAIKHMRPAYR